MTILGPDQIQQWKEDGYLVLPRFFTQDETDEMLNRAKQLIDDFDVDTHPLSAFKSGTKDHIGDDYFIGSNDKIRYFLEPSSLSQATETSPAKLLVEPSRSINKIGHALAVLDPVFRKYTLEVDRVRQIAKDINEHDDPRVLQSMIICKQPKIGGIVPCHNDSTFLYTDPPSAIGIWIALEECTVQNGCLSFLPGSHKSARISTRFVKASGGGTTFIPNPGIEENSEKWEELPGWKEAPCPPGTLVLIHGSVMHRSPPNPSDKSRFIYTFHMIEGGKGTVYDEKNWLQPTKAMPFPSLFAQPTRP